MVTFAELTRKIKQNEIPMENIVRYLNKENLGISGVIIFKIINEKYCNEEIIKKLISFSQLLEGYKFIGPWQYGHVAIAALFLLQDDKATEKYIEIYNSLNDDDKFLVDNFIKSEACK